MNKFFLLTCLLWAGMVSAVTHTIPNKDGNNVFTGTDQFLLGTINGPVSFANITTVPPQTDGTFIYCTDCVVQDPCVGAGPGAFAQRVAGAWDCATHGAGGGSGAVNAGTNNTIAKYVSGTNVGNSGVTDNGTAVATTETFSASQLISTIAIGAAPLVVTSTTVVANLNVSQLLGNTWAAPGTIGGTTPGAATFTNLTATGTLTGIGTVTHTPGALTSGNFIIGNGSADLKDSTFSIVPITNGGTGTATPGLVAGLDISITNSWPNQTIAITDAPTLLGLTWAIPGIIGQTTPNSATFTNLTITGTCTGCGGGGGGAVSSVFGRTGTVVATTGDYTVAQVTNAVSLVPTATQTIQGTASGVINLNAKCPAGAAGSLACLEAMDNAGNPIFQAEQNGTTQFGTGVGGTITLTGIVGPNANPATAGLLRMSNTDSGPCWRNNANAANICFAKTTGDEVTLAAALGLTTGELDLTEIAAPVSAAGHDILYADSTLHAILISLNNGGFVAIPQIAGDLGGTSAAPLVVNINGTSVPTNSTADQVLQTTASATGAWKTLPNCGDASHGLAYTTSTHTWSCQTITGTAGNLADPGANGFLDRTALNTTAARTLTGTASQINITNGGGGGNPVFSLDTTHVFVDTNTITGTNKTIDAEGTGNVLSRPFYVEFTPGCNNATAGPGAFDMPTASAPTFTCFGTTTTHAALDFVHGSTSTATGHFTLPQGWTGNMDVRISWFANSSSTNAVRWSVQSGCVADAGAISTGPSYNTASASNTAYTGTANQRKTTLLSAIAMTNCSAGNEMYFQAQRIGGDAGDTLTAAAEALSVQFEGRTTK